MRIKLMLPQLGIVVGQNKDLPLAGLLIVFQSS